MQRRTTQPFVKYSVITSWRAQRAVRYVMILMFMLSSMASLPLAAQENEQPADLPATEPLATEPLAGTALVVPNAAERKGMIWRAEDKWATADGYNWAGIESDLLDMQNAGAGWVRIAFKQDMPLAFYDQLVPLIRDYDIKILGNTRKMYAPKELGTPAQQQAYRTWLSQVVTRYQNDVRYWEIENETNIPSGWNICLDARCENSDQTAYANAVADYVSLLQQAYETIKAIDPTLQVLIGGLCECGAERFIGELIKLNAHRYFDIMAYHPFGRSPEEVMERFEAIRLKLAEQPALAAKPIWITAIGFHTADWAGTPGKVESETVKADFLLQTMQLLVEGEGVEGPIFWYILSEPIATVNGYGLIFKDTRVSPPQTTYLPAYTAYQELWTTKQVMIITASEDSFVSRNYPWNNYGSDQQLRIGSGSDIRQAYIKFDLRDLRNTWLVQTQLRFLTANFSDAGSTGAQTIRVAGAPSWAESTIKFGVQPNPIVGVIADTEDGTGYQVELDSRMLQHRLGQYLSFTIDTRSADELILQSREWKSSLRLIVYYSISSSSATANAAEVAEPDASVSAAADLPAISAAPDDNVSVMLKDNYKWAEPSTSDGSPFGMEVEAAPAPAPDAEDEIEDEEETEQTDSLYLPYLNVPE